MVFSSMLLINLKLNVPYPHVSESYYSSIQNFVGTFVNVTNHQNYIKRVLNSKPFQKCQFVFCDNDYLFLFTKFPQKSGIMCITNKIRVSITFDHHLYFHMPLHLHIQKKLVCIRYNGEMHQFQQRCCRVHNFQQEGSGRFQKSSAAKSSNILFFSNFSKKTELLHFHSKKTRFVMFLIANILFFGNQYSKG